jgi:pantetheine-phosphate adenylyltransferase
MGKIALYPGSFDPLTYGHLSTVKKLTKCFDQVIVAVGINFEKANYLYDLDQRVALFAAELQKHGYQGVSVEKMDGLLVDFARQVGADVIVRGVRDVQEYQRQLEFIEVFRKQYGGTQPIMLIPSKERYKHISSTLVKRYYAAGKDITEMTPIDIGMSPSQIDRSEIERTDEL